MRAIKAPFGLALLQIACLANAQDDPLSLAMFAEVPGWAVLERGDGACQLHGAFAGDGSTTTFTLIYSVAAPSATFVWSSDAVGDLPLFVETPMDISFLGTTDAGTDEHWPARTFSVSNDNGEHWFMTSFVGDSQVIPVLRDFAISRSVRLSADGQLAVEFPLDGSARAIEKLNECAGADASAKKGAGQ